MVVLVLAAPRRGDELLECWCWRHRGGGDELLLEAARWRGKGKVDYEGGGRKGKGKGKVDCEVEGGRGRGRGRGRLEAARWRGKGKGKVVCEGGGRKGKGSGKGLTARVGDQIWGARVIASGVGVVLGEGAFGWPVNRQFPTPVSRLAEPLPFPTVNRPLSLESVFRLAENRSVRLKPSG
ncbi:unnamed protein product [Linum trigynum]|uniref:Uncharacterized protein n=1 Tax=Linum trigynum TaxID=586398 RepID=A0AAV2FZM0_9ROSI